MERDNEQSNGVWKKKYVDVLQHLAKEKQHSHSSITQLRYGLSRISVAANGIDSTLDRQLVALRRELRNGAEGGVIKTHIESISSTLKDMDESKTKLSFIVLDNIKELLELLQNANLPKVIQSRVNLLINKREAPGAEKIAGTLLSKMAPLFKTFLLLEQQEKNNNGVKSSNGSFFTRLLGKQPSVALEQTVIDSMYSCMGSILEHLPIPGTLEEPEGRLRTQLSANCEADKCEPILKDLTDFIIQVYECDQKKFGSFLTQVGKQLQEVQSFFSTAHNGDERLKHVAEFDSDVRHEVEHIQEIVNDATSTDDIAAAMGVSLSAIVKHVDNYRATEEKRIKEAQEEIVALEKSLNKTETTGEELRISLSKQRQRANRDPLTGLNNRAAYDERLEEEFTRWKRDGAAFVLAVADVDFFKKINDTYGHLAGDKVLKKIGGKLTELTRSTDFIARYGGEEFVLLMRHTPLEAVNMVLEKLRQAIAGCEFHFRGKPVNVTMSFGVTQFKPYDTTDAAFSRADDALYEAKQNGRNQVACKL